MVRVGGERQAVAARMGDRDLIRASDAERQQVVDWLRAAHEDGRLRLDEFTERVGLAYQAVTHGDLATLHADLPPVSPGAESQAAAPAQAASSAAVPKLSVYAELPAALKVLWTIWLVAVSINIVVWVLVMATTGHLHYPWPVWVAGPYGAALLGISIPVVHNRRNRRRAAPLPPPPEDKRQLES